MGNLNWGGGLTALAFLVSPACGHPHSPEPAPDAGSIAVDGSTPTTPPELSDASALGDAGGPGDAGDAGNASALGDAGGEGLPGQAGSDAGDGGEAPATEVQVHVAYTIDTDGDSELWLSSAGDADETATVTLLEHRPRVAAVTIAEGGDRVAYIASASAEPESPPVIWLRQGLLQGATAPQRISDISVPLTYLFDNHLDYVAHCESRNPCAALHTYRTERDDYVDLDDVGGVELGYDNSVLAFTDATYTTLSWLDLSQASPTPVPLHTTAADRQIWFPRGRLAFRDRTLLFVDQALDEPFDWTAYVAFLPDQTPLVVATGAGEGLRGTLQADGRAVLLQEGGSARVYEVEPGLVRDPIPLDGDVNTPRMRTFDAFIPFSRAVDGQLQMFAWEWATGVSRQVHAQACTFVDGRIDSPILFSSTDLGTHAAMHCNDSFGFVRFDEPDSFEPIAQTCAGCPPETFAALGNGLFYGWQSDKVTGALSPHYMAFDPEATPLELIPAGVKLTSVAATLGR